MVAALVAALLSFAVLSIAPVGAASAPVGLGTADAYAVLAGERVTNTGPSVVDGDVGLSPGSAVTGFPPGLVNGTTHAADAEALQAKVDLVTAYDDAAGRTPATAVATELGGTTLLPGVYTGATLGVTGTVTLDADGDANAVFILKTASTLITATDSAVSLINGADPCNVFWQVTSSATLGTRTAFQGTVLALSSITATTGATVQGRLLARNGAVTLDTNVITRPTCDGVDPTTTVVDTTLPDTTVVDTTLPDTTLPNTTLPDTTLPNTTLPDTTLPDTTLPDTTLPDTTLPDTTLPNTTLPDTTLPDTTLPNTTLPDTTLPSTTLPATTLPDTTLPSTSLPDTTLPATTLPSTTLPSTSLPDTTLPSTSLPDTTLPDTTLPSTTQPDTSSTSTTPSSSSSSSTSSSTSTTAGGASSTTGDASSTTGPRGSGSGSGAPRGPGSPSGGTSPGPRTSTGALARTGTSLIPTAVGGAAVLLMGLWLVVVARRRVTDAV